MPAIGCAAVALTVFLHAGALAHAEEVRGAYTPDRIKSDAEASARKAQDAGKSPSPRFKRSILLLSVTRAEFEALGKYTLLFLATWTQKSEELPVKRLFIRANDKETPVRKVSSWPTEVDKNSVTAKMYGPYREDGFYLVPHGALLREGELLVDMSANRTDWEILELPEKSAAAKPQRDPDPAPGAKPDLKTLQELIRRRFNGFPVPLALSWGDR
jgi:hypothetical protein